MKFYTENCCVVRFFMGGVKDDFCFVFFNYDLMLCFSVDSNNLFFLNSDFCYDLGEVECLYLLKQ